MIIVANYLYISTFLFFTFAFEFDAFHLIIIFKCFLFFLTITFFSLFKLILTPAKHYGPQQTSTFSHRTFAFEFDALHLTDAFTLHSLGHLASCSAGLDGIGLEVVREPGQVAVTDERVPSEMSILRDGETRRK